MERGLASLPARVLVLITALLAGMPGLTRASDSSDSVSQWLERMQEAIDTTDFRGIMIHVRGDRIDTLGIIHRVDDDGVRERIHALDGPPREILRTRDHVRCLLSETETMVVPNPFPGRLLTRLPVAALAGQDAVYRMGFAGEERVAGRATRVVEIRPSDEYRYGHRFWLDMETGMPLRSALLDERGKPVQQLSFVSIEFGVEISDAELEPEFDRPVAVAEFSGQPVARGSDAALRNQPSWLPARLPPGFQLSSVGRESGAGGKHLEHLLFSDGLASFSIYVEDAGPDRIADGIDRMGPVHVYTGMLEDQRITVVGEVPAPTVAVIGRHLRRASQPAAMRHFD